MSRRWGWGAGYSRKLPPGPQAQAPHALRQEQLLPYRLWCLKAELRPAPRFRGIWGPTAPGTGRWLGLVQHHGQCLGVAFGDHVLSQEPASPHGGDGSATHCEARDTHWLTSACGAEGRGRGAVGSTGCLFRKDLRPTVPRLRGQEGAGAPGEGASLDPPPAPSAHRAMMMTACDLSAITKPWEIQSKVSHRLGAACLLVGLACGSQTWGRPRFASGAQGTALCWGRAPMAAGWRVPCAHVCGVPRGPGGDRGHIASGMSMGRSLTQR